MKLITREVKMYKYTFANIDIQTGNATNMQEVTIPEPMGMRDQRKYSAEHDNAILIHTEEFSRKFAMPLSEFIKCCEWYAEKVAEGEAEAITDSDEEETAVLTDEEE